MSGKSTISIGFLIEDAGGGLKKLTLDADALRKVMSENVKVAEQMQEKIFKIAALSTILNSVNTAVSQLSNTLANITSESAEFSKAMKAANTMAGKDSEGFKHLKGEIADLAKQIPIARDQLANGLYQVISNGVPEDNWIEYLNASARSAIGGMADINKVVGVTSTVIKNYGLEWSAAAGIQDKIQLTAKNGVTSFEQLSQALPRVTGNAATLGVTIDELLGSFATLTGVSGNTAEVSTQLAAIFTALVKPSSEAGKMAAEMGIQFDAAAIKAAGGFQNFLQQLDSSIKAYAATSGILEQEIYGRLFGSAESLRALIPLQGELADKFTTNVDAMVNSAGTMDAAYKDMASTGGAVNQMLSNQWASVIDVIAGFTSASQPYINFSAGLLSTASNALVLTTAFKQLNTTQHIVAVRTKLVGVAMTALGFKGYSLSRVLQFIAKDLTHVTASATAAKFAIRGLMVTTGIGIAIAAVTMIIEHFCGAVDAAADEVDKLKKGQEAIKKAQSDFSRVVAETSAALDMEAAKLRVLLKNNIDTAATIAELNKKYGESLGIHKSASEWLDVLTDKTKDYALMLGYQQKMQSLANAAAEANINKQKTGEEKAEWEKNNQKQRRVARKDKVTGLSEVYWTDDEWKNLRDNYNAYSKELEDIATEQERVIELMDKLQKQSGIKLPKKEIDVAIDIKPTISGQTNDKNIKDIIPENSIKDISNRISKLQAKIDIELDPDKRRELYKEIERLEAHKIWMEVGYKYDKLSLQDLNNVIPSEHDTKPITLPAQLDIKIDMEKVGEQMNNAIPKPVQMVPLDQLINPGLESMSLILGTLSELTNESAAAWLQWGANVLDACRQALPAIMAVTGAKAAESAVATPIIGWTMAGLAIASVIASFAQLPKFAKGGIISGPTIGLMGEYAGASNNPEVVAPLDKLRGMLQPVENSNGGVVRFKIDGRTLVGILEKETNLKYRS